LPANLDLFAAIERMPIGFGISERLPYPMLDDRRRESFLIGSHVLSPPVGQTAEKSLAIQ
jgi:hypothetical protein